MYIDPHVHCRDEEQSYKETIAHTLKVAENAGFTAIFDMPNTQRPVTTKDRVLERARLFENSQSPLCFGIYMALTEDENQVKHAVETYKNRPIKNSKWSIVGFKLYAGNSTGNIGVTIEDKQRLVYKTLAKEDYKGVLVVHAEKESLFRPGLFDPKKPITHAYARPPESEVESVKDQIRFAKESGFRGTLHIAHVSVPESVNIIYEERDINVTCGVTPHHLIFDYNKMEEPDGLLLKMNPPLREPGMNKELLEMLKGDQITWIETDHAPHTLEEKLNNHPMSGIPNLQAFPKFINWLSLQGVTHDKISLLTYHNIQKVFNMWLPQLKSKPVENIGEYEFDPYKGVL